MTYFEAWAVQADPWIYTPEQQAEAETVLAAGFVGSVNEARQAAWEKRARERAIAGACLVLLLTLCLL